LTFPKKIYPIPPHPSPFIFPSYLGKEKEKEKEKEKKKREKERKKENCVES